MARSAGVVWFQDCSSHPASRCSASPARTTPAKVPFRLQTLKLEKGSTMNSTMRVVSPEGLPLRPAGSVSRHLDSLEGKTIGEVYNNHFKGELMFRTYRRLFQQRYPGVEIVPFDQFPIVYVGGDPSAQRKTAKEIARLAEELGRVRAIAAAIHIECAKNLSHISA